MIKKGRFAILAGLIFCLAGTVSAQRTYAPNSLLSTGNWYKLSVKEAGVYKIDIPFLNALGIPTTNLSSSSIKLYGNGGSMLAEANSGSYTDDLVENAIEVVDGGDGIMNGGDHDTTRS